MINLLSSLLHVEVLITALVGFAAFGTVLTIAAPYFENDKLSARIKLVSLERDRLRAQQKAQLAGGETKLRDRPRRGLYPRLLNRSICAVCLRPRTRVRRCDRLA